MYQVVTKLFQKSVTPFKGKGIIQGGGGGMLFKEMQYVLTWINLVLMGWIPNVKNRALLTIF